MNNYSYIHNMPHIGICQQENIEIQNVFIFPVLSDIFTPKIYFFHKKAQVQQFKSCRTGACYFLFYFLIPRIRSAFSTRSFVGGLIPSRA